MKSAIRIIESLSDALGLLSGSLSLFITLIVVLDVALRGLFHAPVPGATEASTLLLIGIIYLGFASVQANKANFRVEILLMNLPDGARRWMEIFTTILSAVTIGVLAWFTAGEAWSSLIKNEMTFGAIAFPVWPARIAIVIGLAVLLLQLLCDIARLTLGLEDGKTAEGGFH